MGCLKNLTIASVGDHGSGKGNEQLRKWVDNNGGRWVPKVQKGITHLIASKDAWKEGVDSGTSFYLSKNMYLLPENKLDDGGSLEKCIDQL
jgi:hypothetical protein